MRNKIKRILIYAPIVLILSAFAVARNNESLQDDDILIVTYVDTRGSDIVAGNTRISKPGIRFKANQNIKWSNKNQSIKVRNTRTGKIYVICAKECDNSTPTMASWYIKRSPTFTKSGIDGEALRSVFENTFYMVDDTLFIESPIPIDQFHGFSITQIGGNGTRIYLPYDNDTGDIVIPSDYLQQMGVDIHNINSVFHVDYWEGQNPVPVTDNMIIDFLRQ